jgi:molybdenum cofactor cytidylyltransferase
VPVTALVLAAGESSRFGSPKLVADVGGEPLLNRTIRCLLDAAVPDVVVVVSATGPGPILTPAVVPLLGDPRVRLVTNRDPARGMFSSIQAGCTAAAGGDPVLVLPGDMPFVRSRTVAAVIARYAEVREVVSPRHDGRRGHPIALPPELRIEILNADSATTLNVLLKSCAPERVYVDVDDAGILRDVDRREDL